MASKVAHTYGFLFSLQPWLPKTAQDWKFTLELCVKMHLFICSVICDRDAVIDFFRTYSIFQFHSIKLCAKIFLQITYMLLLVRLWSFLFGGSKLVRFFCQESIFNKKYHGVKRKQTEGYINARMACHTEWQKEKNVQKIVVRCFHNKYGPMCPQLSQLGYLEWL